MRAFLSDLTDSHPAPTCLVHLAALPPIEAPFAAFDEERFVQQRAVALDSALVLCKAILPRMAAAGGGRVYFPAGQPGSRDAASCILQGAVEGLAHALAAEYACAGVDVRCVSPAQLPGLF